MHFNFQFGQTFWPPLYYGKLFGPPFRKLKTFLAPSILPSPPLRYLWLPKGRLRHWKQKQKQKKHAPLVFSMKCTPKEALRGYCTSYPKKAPKLACFALYLEIINIFLKNNTSHSKLSIELKNSIEIKVGQAVLELLIQKQHFDCFNLFWKIAWPTTNFSAIFEFLEQFCIRWMFIFQKSCWLFWDRAQNVLIFVW